LNAEIEQSVRMSSTHRLRLFAIVAIAITAACDDPADLPRPLAPFSVTPSSLYAGSELKIIGSDAARLTEITLARGNAPADSIPLEILGHSGDTVVVAVPSTARGGDYQLRLRGHVLPLANVRIAGFREAHAHEEFACNNLDVVGGSVASIIETRTSNALIKYFPGNDRIQELVPASHLKTYQYAIGRSYRPEIVFVQPPASPFEAWNIAGAGRLVGNVPYRFPTALFQISDSVFVRTISISLSSAILRDTTWVGVEELRYFNDVTGAALSADGELGLVMFNYSPTYGQPVFDGTTGRVRYFVPLKRGYYARFSTTQDTLFIAGVDSTDANVLLAIDPQNGNEFARREVDTGSLAGLALDAFNNRIFVATEHEYRIVDIHILDARTFEPLARMRGENPHMRFCSQLVFDNSGIFIVDTHSTMSFDYLP
jgi:hypothetical protein